MHSVHVDTTVHVHVLFHVAIAHVLIKFIVIMVVLQQQDQRLGFQNQDYPGLLYGGAYDAEKKSLSLPVHKSASESAMRFTNSFSPPPGAQPKPITKVSTQMSYYTSSFLSRGLSTIQLTLAEQTHIYRLVDVKL